MHESFFFGPAGRQLFASYHAPVSGTGTLLTVICPPLLSELNRTHAMLRKVAVALSQRGQHVLRFDYRGTGDSFGDSDEPVVEDWIADIGLAVREACDLSGCRAAQVLAVRAAALLAARAVEASQQIRRLVLWDPVYRGAAYLDSLRDIQMNVLDRNAYITPGEYAEAAREHAGFRLSQGMVDGLGALDAGAWTPLLQERVRIVSTVPEDVCPLPGVAREVVPFACNWERGTEAVIVAQPVLEQLVTCLTSP